MKSKIEEKIEKAREATNEMFAAFDELNEMLAGKLKIDLFEFKKGNYLTMITSYGNYVGILRKPVYVGNGGFPCYVGINPQGNINFYFDYGFQSDDAMRFSTPEEIALLDSKLAEQGKRFDKEKLELVDIPKHKEPIIGEMAIFWDNDKCNAACKILDDDSGAFFIDNSETYWINAILFESPEQYKAFLKS